MIYTFTKKKINNNNDRNKEEKTTFEILIKTHNNKNLSPLNTNKTKGL